jgi:hypothetical protein
VNREQLVNAAYNPREISDQERARLKKGLERHGLVEPLVWNRRTGNLVSGHQRISIMDTLMGKKDYTMRVSVIDVDEKRERELNVLLNNTAAMGSFDLEKLRTMFDDEAVKIEGAGFDTSEMVRLFGDSVLDDRENDLREFAEHLAKISDHYTAVQERNKRKDASEHFLVFVFPDGEHVDAFIRAAKLEDRRYQNGLLLLDKWDVPSPEKKP